MTIYTKAVDVPASTTIEIFSELGIDPINARVVLQAVVDGSQPGLQLSQDSSGTQLGVFLCGPTVFTGSGFVIGQMEVPTDKDPVYITNSSGGSVNLYFAVYPGIAEGADA